MARETLCTIAWRTVQPHIFSSYFSNNAEDTPLFPSLPKNFLGFFRWVNIFNFLDVDWIPFNCVFQTNFHSKLVMITVSPIVFVGLIGFMGLVQRQRIMRMGQGKSKGELHVEVQKMLGKCTFIVVLFIFSVFPIVSSIIMQSFSYQATRRWVGVFESRLLHPRDGPRSALVHCLCNRDGVDFLSWDPSHFLLFVAKSKRAHPRNPEGGDERK